CRRRPYPPPSPGTRSTMSSRARSPSPPCPPASPSWATCTGASTTAPTPWTPCWSGPNATGSTRTSSQSGAARRVIRRGNPGDGPGGQRAAAVRGDMKQHGRGQAARTYPQPRQEHAAGRRRRDARGDAGQDPPPAREPVDAKGSRGGANVPDAEDATRHRDRRAAGHAPAQRRLQHPAEGGLFPQDGAERDAHQRLVGDLAPAQAPDPVVAEDRARRRHRGDEHPPAPRGGDRRGSEPRARPQLLAREAHGGGG